MQIDRNEFIQELVLRESVRKAIKIVKAKRMSKEKERHLAESQIRKLVQRLIEEEGDDGPVPHQSTGINVLEELLKKIIPIIEIEYKQLTTDPKQRESFRAHIVNAIQNALAPTKAIKGDSEMAPGDVPEVPEEEDELAMEAIEMVVDDDPETGPEDMDSIGDASGGFAGDDQSQFIDISGGADGSTDKFGIDGEEQTGRNFAEKTFEKVETQITDAYKLLSNDEDRELFYDYLVANMKLYFDKFEDELASILPEPTNPEYEDEKGAEDEADAEGEEAAEEGGDDLGGDELGGDEEEELGGGEEITLQEGFGLGKQDLVNLGLDFNMVKGGYFDQIVITAERKGPTAVAKSIIRALQRNPSLAKDPSGLLATL